ncbi:MAG TPA: TetR/AcrR family transcriptional regulator [Gemmatimonadaceae bacterium]|nr:TetR/AcrR family transcriptional regulator [Gemmatimonadaceae bacterium]
MTDRRIQKTQALLQGALVDLVHERDYDAIPIKQILARANVGRSTFYAHFRDKDELLDSCILAILSSERASKLRRSARGPERLVWFSLPLFEYLEHRHAAEPTAGLPGRAIVHEHLRRALADLIRAETSGSPVPPDLLAEHVASTFVRVLDWWVDHARAKPASEIDALFRMLIMPAVTAVT